MMKWVHFQCHKHTHMYTFFMQNPIREIEANLFQNVHACQTIKTERSNKQTKRDREKKRNMRDMQNEEETKRRTRFIWWIMYLSQFVTWIDRTHTHIYSNIHTPASVHRDVEKKNCSKYNTLLVAGWLACWLTDWFVGWLLLVCFLSFFISSLHTIPWQRK